MIRSIIIPFILILLSAFFSYFETLSIVQTLSQAKHDKIMNSFFRESQFLTSVDRVKILNKALEQINNTNTPFLEHKNTYESGKLNLILGLENANVETKFSTLCGARENFKTAASLSPRNVNYQLSLADIESISPYLAQSCDQAKIDLKTPNTSVTQNISLAERLNWIENLSPLDPPTLYKKGLIEKALGQRINAMTSFRRFDETSLVSTAAHRDYLISQVNTRDELSALIPAKFPNTLNWLYDFKKVGNTSIDYNSVFESKLIEMVKNLVSSGNQSTTDNQELLKKLFTTYWSEDIQDYQELKTILAKSLFRTLALNSNNRFATDYFRILSNSNQSRLNITNQFSNISKKTGKSFNWINNSSTNNIGIDLRSEGFGLFINSPSKNNLITIQGQRGEKFPESLTPEIWISKDNIAYSQVKALDSKFTVGLIDSIPTAYIDLGRLNQKYIKVFFNYQSEHAYRISGTPQKILQVYQKN